MKKNRLKYSSPCTHLPFNVEEVTCLTITGYCNMQTQSCDLYHNY